MCEAIQVDYCYSICPYRQVYVYKQKIAPLAVFNISKLTLRRDDQRITPRPPGEGGLKKKKALELKGSAREKGSNRRLPMELVTLWFF